MYVILRLKLSGAIVLLCALQSQNFIKLLSRKPDSRIKIQCVHLYAFVNDVMLDLKTKNADYYK